MRLMLSILLSITLKAQVLVDPYSFPAVVENNNLLSDLVALWAQDEASGYAVDSSTNLYHLTQLATVATNIGKIDGSRDYVGALNGFHTNSTALAYLSTNEFTIAFWFKPDSAFTQGTIISSGDFDGAHNWLISMTSEASQVTYVGGRDMYFGVNGFPFNELHVALGTDEFPPEDWYFCYVRRTVNHFDMGIVYPLEEVISSVDNYAYPGAFEFTAFGDDFTLGTALNGGAPDVEWEGGLDHIGFWRRSLSDCEIMKLVRLRKYSQFDTDPCD